MEIWKAVIGYEDIYEVSNFGNVRSLPRMDSNGHEWKGKTLKQAKSGKNKPYLKVNLCKEGTQKVVYVHRIVAQAFLPNPENKYDVNHIDGDKLNNKLENLEWVTRKENIKHACDNGLSPRGEQRGKLTENQVLEIYKRGKEGEMQKSLAREFEVNVSAICKILKGDNWSWLTNDGQSIR